MGRGSTPDTSASVPLDRLISPYSARLHRVIPVAVEGETLIVISDRAALNLRDRTLTFLLGRPVRVADPELFAEHRRRFHELLDHYSGGSPALGECQPCACPDSGGETGLCPG